MRGARSLVRHPHPPAHRERMDAITTSFLERGDLAHLALFLWASGASTLLMLAFRELAAAQRRFDAFVRELARFNARHGEGEH